MGPAHKDGVFRKQVHQPGKGQEVPLGLVGFQAAVQFQNGFHRPYRQDMPALGDVGLHAGEDGQPVKDQGIPLPVGLGGDIAVEFGEAPGVEMLGQAEGVQPGRPGFAKKPVGVFFGKGQLFGQLAVGMKIQIHLLPPVIQGRPAVR